MLERGGIVYRKNTAWTPAELQSLEQLRQIDVPTHVIARMLGRSESAVRRIQRPGRNARDWFKLRLRSDVHDLLVLEAAKQGMTPVELLRCLVSCVAVDNLWNSILDLREL